MCLFREQTAENNRGKGSWPNVAHPIPSFGSRAPHYAIPEQNLLGGDEMACTQSGEGRHQLKPNAQMSDKTGRATDSWCDP